MLVRSPADGYSDFRVKRLLYGIVADSRANLNICPQMNPNGELALCEKQNSTVRRCAESSESWPSARDLPCPFDVYVYQNNL